ncbi:retrotransposon protein, putative, ty1-copia subclass [Tanacetum coccineum]
MGKTIGELHALLIEYEKGLPKNAATPQVMAIQCGRIQKANKKSQNAKGKGKGKGKRKDKSYIPKPKNPKPNAKEHLAKNDACHHCKEVGHWKRNCPVYLAELMKSKKQVGTASSSGARKLKQCDLYLYVGNGVRAQVEAIGSFDLILPNSLVICLDNCHYAPSITRGVVSVHRLVENGFVQCFTDFGILVSKNNVHYFNAIPSNGIYEIDMHDLVPNDNSIYNVSTKRAKLNLDSTYLWHSRLAHISKKCIEKLQQEGLLKSTDDESFNQCVSCLSGKMTRKSFPHRPERATDLLGIIHTDVCGPLRHVSRQGASYFITFTDDYSRYGYVYLLKHKHEVFETFKVFKNEVENQLGKTIKALRSDRGGEYISQEFKDYLKACGIVQQLTPPYTPQHNGVSERRNRTLLDMVRSMMNLTTLPLSFWDYALESATRILNMVPTKKALVKRDTPEKLQQRSVKCIFIGYPKETMGYYFYFPSENKIVVARYAKFFEKNLITQEVSGRVIDLEEIQDEDTSPSEITSEIPMEVEGFAPPQEEEIPIRRSERSRRVPNRLCLNVEAEEHSLGDLNEPTSYKAAMLDSESNKWIDAMNAEIQSMMDNMVWVLVDLPPNYKTIGSKWILKKKTDMDDIVHTYKAHLIAKGYTQIYGVNYEETFSPVPAIRAIKILISIAADRSKRLIGLGQNAYMDKILKRYKMDNSKRGHIPMQERLDLNKTQGAVDWKSSKQSTTTMSATEAEYIAASEAAMEAVWIRKFISGLGIVPTINEPIKKFCDNLAALHFANETGVQRGARHYHKRYHYVRESIALGEIRFLKVHTDDNLADPFTKALSKGNDRTFYPFTNKALSDSRLGKVLVEDGDEVERGQTLNRKSRVGIFSMEDVLVDHDHSHQMEGLDNEEDVLKRLDSEFTRCAEKAVISQYIRTRGAKELAIETVPRFLRTDHFCFEIYISSTEM